MSTDAGEACAHCGRSLGDLSAPTGDPASTTSPSDLATPQRARATRERLPAERVAVTRVFRLPMLNPDGTIEPMHLYVTPGEYADGRVGEVFIKADKAGSLARGTLDAVSVMMSMLIQYGVPLEVITAKLIHTRYQPAGVTGDRDFPICSSPLDLVAQYLNRRYGQRGETP